jgi:hypothetical protein
MTTVTTNGDEHGGYVAGRYRDGSLSDGWTDVARCAPGTFVRYVGRCACGWIGRPRPATASGAMSARREWFLGHVTTLPLEVPAPR